MGTFNTKSRYSDVHSALGLDESSAEEASEPPQVLSLLASVLERSIQKNEKLLKRSKTKHSVSIYHGSRAPTLSIRLYIERIFKYANCSPSCFVVAYIYMDRFIQQTNYYLTSWNVHRLLIACFVVATKYVEDVGFNNAYFAKVGGVSIGEMNKLELKLLSSLHYRLHVTLETFDQYCLHLQKEGATNDRSNQTERAIHTCGLKGSWFKKDQPKCTSRFAGYTCGAI